MLVGDKWRHTRMGNMDRVRIWMRVWMGVWGGGGSGIL